MDMQLGETPVATTKRRGNHNRSYKRALADRKAKEGDEEGRTFIAHSLIFIYIF